MNEEQLLWLQNNGYTVSEFGHITNPSGDWVEKVETGLGDIYSDGNHNDYLAEQNRNKELEDIGFKLDENSSDSPYKQGETAMAAHKLKQYTEDKNGAIPSANDPNFQSAFEKHNQELADTTGEEYMDAEDFFKVHDNSAIAELREAEPTALDQLSDVKQKKLKIQEEDPDFDTKLKKWDDTDKRLAENSWYNPENISIYTEKAWTAIFKAISPTGAGMDDEKKKAEYLDLVQKEKELFQPAIQSKINKAQALIEEMKVKRQEALDNGEVDVDEAVIVDIPYLADAVGGQDISKMDYMMDRQQDRVDQLQNYMDHKDDNWFTANVWNPFETAGKESIRKATFADFAFNMLSVRTAAERYNKGEGTPADELILRDFASQADHEEFMGQLPSVGAVHDTVGGITHSVGFMADMIFGGGLGKKGSKFAAKKLGAKYLDDAILMAINKIGTKVPKSLKPITKATLNSVRTATPHVVEAAAMPLTMGATWTGASENQHKIIVDKDNKILLDNDAYDYQMTKLEGDRKISQSVLDALSAKPALSEAEKVQLKQAMSFLGTEGEVHGVSRNKAVPTVGELTQTLKPSGSFSKAYVDSYKQNLAETLSEKAGMIGFGKVVANTRLGRTLLDNKLGTFITSTSQRVNKASGGHVQSVLDEMIEENLVPVINYALDGKESDLHSMMNLKAQKDVAIQTMGMNLLFRVPGSIRDVATKSGRDNKKWRREQRELNHQNKERLSGLYKSIANVGSTEDLSKIIDLSAITPQDAQQSMREAMVLDMQGKPREAAVIRDGIFEHNAIQAVRTGTTRQFENSLIKLTNNPNIDAATRTSAMKAREVLTRFSEHEKTHGRKYGARAIVGNLMNRDLQVKALKDFKDNRRDELLKNKETAEMFDRNFERSYVSFVKENTADNGVPPAEHLASGINLLEKRFVDPNIQNKYERLLVNSAKNLTPEFQTIVNKVVTGENALRESIETSDKLHIELTSRRHQATLKNRGLVEQALAQAYTEKGDGISESDMDSAINSVSTASKALSKEELNNIKGEFMTELKAAQARKEAQIQQDISANISNSVQNQADTVDAEPDVDPDNTPTPTVDPDAGFDPDAEFDNPNPNTTTALANSLAAGAGMTITLGDPDGAVEPAFDPDAAEPDFDPDVDTEPVFDFLIPGIDGTYKSSELNALSDSLKEFSSQYKGELGRKPSFKDFMEFAFENLDGDKEALRPHFESYGLAWEKADLGPSQWKKLYNENYSSLRQSVAKALSVGMVGKTLGEQESQAFNNTVETKEIQKVEKPQAINNVTGEVTIEVPAPNTTRVVTAKVGFQAIAYKEVDENIDGKRSILKENDFSQGVQLKDSETIDFRKLINPNTNNVGDALNIQITTEADWNDAVISNRDPQTGKRLGTMVFSDWIVANKPTDMSLEDFKETEKFQGKVPMFYVDSQGNRVGYVHEADWYNPTNIADPTTSEIDFNNISVAHKALVAEGKAEANKLRKQIISGEVSEVKITSKGGSPWTYVPSEQASKSLEEVAPDSKIIKFFGGQLYDLNQGELKNTRILNEDLIYETQEDGTYTNANRAFHLRHVATKNENGVEIKEYHALHVLRKNEANENGINTEDSETMKWLFAAQNRIVYGDKSRFANTNSPYFLTTEEAETIAAGAKRVSGKERLNIQDFRSLESYLVRLGSVIVNDVHEQTITGGYKHMFGKGIGIVQHTYVGPNSNYPMFNVKRGEDGKFTVNKIADNYDSFLKKRLTTDVMGFNVGTEANPVFTHLAQPIVNVEAVVDITPKTIEEVIEETQEEKQAEIQEVVEAVVAETSVVSAQEVSEVLAENEAILETLNIDFDLDHDYLVPNLENTVALEKSIDKIDSITLRQESEIVTHLFSTISNKFENSEEVTKSQFFNEIEDGFKERYSALEQKLGSSLLKLENIYDASPESSPALLKNINKSRQALEMLENLQANYDKLRNKAYQKAVKVGFVSSRAKTKEEIEEEFKDETTLNVADYTKNANEQISKDKVGTKLRRLFSGISIDNKGFLGTPRYTGFNDMHNTVMGLLVRPMSIDPDFDSMMSKLEMHKDSYPWVEPLVNKLRNSDQQVQNQFVYAFYKKATRAKFAAYTTNAQGGIDSNIWNTNSNDVKRRILVEWKNNFKRGAITSESYINPAKLKDLHDTWESWGTAKHTQDDATVRAWLSDFGFIFSDGAWKELKDGGFTTVKSGRSVQISYENLFVGTKKRGESFIHNLAMFAEQHKEAEPKALNFIENIKLHPFDDMSNILNVLTEIEGRNNNKYHSTTHRDNGKSISETQASNHFFNTVERLVRSSQGDQQYLTDLKDVSFSSNSHILDLLLTNEDFATKFQYAEVGITSLKELFKDTPMFVGIDEISALDYMFQQRAIFQNTKQGTLKGKHFGFERRMSHMSTPTNSDKGRMMLVKTAVFNLYSQHESAFKVEEDGSVSFTEDLKELLYDQLIEPELKRALNHKKTNIKGYDKGATRFNLIPVVNTVVGKGGQTVAQHLRNGSHTPETFKEEFFAGIMDAVQNNIVSEVEGNITQLESFKKEEIDTFNNMDYLSARKGTFNTNRKLAELDYTINAMISNMNIFQLIAGDPAIYFKSKEDVNSPALEVQESISNSLGINLGKRLALMIAPGEILANSKDEKYLQVFLEDNEEVASNAEMLVRWHYGEKALAENFNGKPYSQHIQDLRDGKISKENKKQLFKKFSKVSEFFTVESTDAQEYTTVKEHLRVLRGQGRITADQELQITDKLSKGQDITKEEVGLVFQVIKPVHTGTFIDKAQDVNRMMYIKSSSFPLLPQLTRGRELDALRIKMEELEETAGKTVRASYQTANKVGAMTSTIDPMNQASIDRMFEVDADGTPLNYLELDRGNFRIQQDVPFKSGKKQADKVTMGTQIFKLLFGNGIMDAKGFEFKGEEFSGEELQKKFFDVFSSMVTLQKDQLLDELGLDQNMKSKNSRQTAEKLQEMLIAEAIDRGFSDQDIKALELQTKKKGDREYYHFKLPLWFSANSNKYESMFNAIINNRIFKQKLPGNGMVVGSESGFQVKDNFEGVDKSRIIHLGNFQGGELGGADVKDGSFKKAQILIPSKFKTADGVLLDMFQDFNGTQGKYLTRDEKGFLKLKEDMVDPKLLEQFTFRIPTSSHGSGATVEVAGFLPPENGDLCITPKGFVAQMGQDFDVDKLTNYQYHHVINGKGKIEILDEKHKTKALSGVKKKIQELQASGAFSGNLGESLSVFDQMLVQAIGEEELIDIISQEDIDLDEKVNKISKKYDLMLAQNDFIDIHNSVYSNKSPEVQTAINKVLSMDFAEGQAEGIEEMLPKETNTFNILSPNYQRKKMNLGSTGAVGIGIYAKGVTFHSMAQQSNVPVGLVGEDENGGPYKKTFQMGSIISDGTFGNKMTLSSENASEVETKLRRTVAIAQDERTNTATDNEKAQILGRVGLNYKEAISVDNLLSLLGIDSEINAIAEKDYDANNPFHKTATVDGQEVFYTEHSLPYLLHSQPFVKEYFKRVSEAESIVTDFTQNAKETIIFEMLHEKLGDGYSIHGGSLVGLENDELVSLQDNTQFTAENMVNEVKSGGDPLFQAQILAFYLDLIEEAKVVKNVSGLVDLNNLGKSMWESNSKAEQFRDLAAAEEVTGLSGISGLLGEFVDSDTAINIGGVPFTPKSNQGIMVGTALSLSETLFEDYFPYKDRYIAKNMDFILDNANVNRANPFATLQTKEQIFQEIKKFITSATHNGIYMDSPQEVRNSLFMDTDNNTSLSSYVGGLMNYTGSDFKAGLNVIKNNRLLSSMSYDLGENGKPSLIKFNNSEVGDVDQEYLYNSFRELLLQDKALPTKNGQPYSTRELAQELIAYSFAGGNIVQGAVEFHKFIPLEYFDDIFILDKKGNKHTVTKLLQHYDTLNSNWADSDRLKGFATQYFQNNPEKAPQLTKADTKIGKFKDNGNTFIHRGLMPTDIIPAYISMKVQTKSKLKQDKWRLYRNIGGNMYAKTPVLGEFGMSEYSFGDSVGKSNLAPTPKNVVAPVQQINVVQTAPTETEFKIKTGNSPLEVLTQISKDNSKLKNGVKEIAEALKPFVSATTNIKVINDKEQRFIGRSSRKDGAETILINEAFLGNASDTEKAQVFLHEFIHSISSAELVKHVNFNTGEVSVDAPKEVTALNILFTEYTNKIAKAYPLEYKEFVAKMETLVSSKKNNQKVPVGFTQREREVFYPTYNLKEFMATALGNNDMFLEEASNFSYKKSGDNIIAKFAKLIVNLLNRVAKNNQQESNMAAEALLQTLNTLEVLNPVSTKRMNSKLEPEMTEADMKSLESEPDFDPDNDQITGETLNLLIPSQDVLESLPEICD